MQTEEMTNDDRFHHVAQANHAHQPARLGIGPPLNDDKPVHTPSLDEAEDGAERVSRLARHHTGKIARALLERLGHVEVQSLEGAIADQGLNVSSALKARAIISDSLSHPPFRTG